MRKSAADREEEKEDRFSNFVYYVFTAIVLGAGGVIWSLVASSAALDKRVTVLEVKCIAPSLVPPVHSASPPP